MMYNSSSQIKMSKLIRNVRAYTLDFCCFNLTHTRAEIDISV